MSRTKGRTVTFSCSTHMPFLACPFSQKLLSSKERTPRVSPKLYSIPNKKNIQTHLVILLLVNPNSKTLEAMDQAPATKYTHIRASRPAREPQHDLPCSIREPVAMRRQLVTQTDKFAQDETNALL